MQKIYGRRAVAGIGVVALVALAGCENAGQQRNFDRFDQYSEILASGRLSSVANLDGVVGTAEYVGTGFGEFPAADEPPDEDDERLTYTATADVQLSADFTEGTLGGTMTGWTTEDPGNFEMKGIVRISDGRIEQDGTFTSLVSGSVERRDTARRTIERRESPGEDDLPEAYLVGIVGSATGTFHDSLDGARATHIIGNIEAGNMTGGFAAQSQ